MQASIPFHVLKKEISRKTKTGKQTTPVFLTLTKLVSSIFGENTVDTLTLNLTRGANTEHKYNVIIIEKIMQNVNRQNREIMLN